jgi:3-oxoacyl-[acyl-carrier-protein] synthase II
VRRRVVITGIGVVSPVGIGVEPFWNAVRHGRSGVRRLTAFDPTPFSCQVAAEIPEFRPEDFFDSRTACRMGRHSQFAVAAARLAVADGQLDLDHTDRGRCGAVLGCCFGDMAASAAEDRVLTNAGRRRVSPLLIPLQLGSMAAGEVAIQLGVRGVNYVVSAACASANHAIGLAARHIAHGDADVVFAGGTEAPLTPLLVAGFCQTKALATGFNDTPEKASRPFDAARRGFVPGEGAAVLLLESLDHARTRDARVYAELAGFAANDDAHHATAPDPEGRGLAEAITAALADAGVALQDVDYVNAHGTSTLLNDKAETRAIKRAFGERAGALSISSTKSMVGHLLGAAGAVELAATALGISHEIIPPTINLETPDPDCDLDYVPGAARERHIRCAISNSSGFGGQNSVLVVRRFD